RLTIGRSSSTSASPTAGTADTSAGWGALTKKRYAASCVVGRGVFEASAERLPPKSWRNLCFCLVFHPPKPVAIYPPGDQWQELVRERRLVSRLAALASRFDCQIPTGLIDAIL